MSVTLMAGMSAAASSMSFWSIVTSRPKVASMPWSRPAFAGMSAAVTFNLMLTVSEPISPFARASVSFVAASAPRQVAGMVDATGAAELTSVVAVTRRRDSIAVTATMAPPVRRLVDPLVGRTRIDSLPHRSWPG
jgi:hypothetical protein